MSKKKQTTQVDSQNPDQAWKTTDLGGALKQDLQAAMACLNIILNTPEVFQGVHKVLEDHRQTLIRRETENANARIPDA